MQPMAGSGAGLAESIESGQGAFATTTFGQLRTTSACSEPGTLTIGLDGELDIASAPRLGQLLAELDRDRWTTVVLDLRHLSFIAPAGYARCWPPTAGSAAKAVAWSSATCRVPCAEPWLPSVSTASSASPRSSTSPHPLARSVARSQTAKALGTRATTNPHRTGRARHRRPRQAFLTSSPPVRC